MARTRKSIQPLNLYKYDVLIEDKGTRSDYFKISQFDGYFYGGRNAFLIAGATNLKPGTNILVEILNKDGTTVYSAPVTAFIEGNSRLVQVEVYSDTPIGPGKIVILGCTETYSDGRSVPDEWKNKYNVRWITDVIISPRVQNKTPIRFVTNPSVVVEEKFYKIPSSSLFEEKLLVPVDIKLTPKYYNVFQNGYTIKVEGPGSTKLTSDYLGGSITGSVSITQNSITETASIFLPITKIFNENLAESQGSLIYTNKNRLVSDIFLSSSGVYTYPFITFGEATISGSVNLQYSKLETFNTGSAISYAKLRIVDAKTLSGEINKVRVSYKITTEPGEYVVLSDVGVGVQELFVVDSGSRLVQTGKFSNLNINDYWYTATMSLQKNENSPTLPEYYTSSSLIGSSISEVECCQDLLDAINVTPTIVNNKYVDEVSYFIGNRKENPVQLFPRSEYTLTFDAIVSKNSQSVLLNQEDYSLEVYLVPQDGTTTKLLETNPRGQLLGTITPTSTFAKQNFENTEFNFIPKIIETGNFGIRFVVYGGFWNIANVSLKPALETLFSPDEIELLIPNVNYVDKILSYKIQYLDINNNSSGIETISIPTYFTGSESSVTSTPSTNTSASYAATSSFISHANPGDNRVITSLGSGSLNAEQNLQFDGSTLSVTGSMVVSGSATLRNIGPAQFTGSVNISGSTTVTGDLTVSGLLSANSQSITYVSSSQLNVGTNIITVNVQNPIPRFGGLAVIDSGSSPQRSGSLLFDSLNDQWIFVHQNQTSPTSSVLLMGPQTFNNIGNETLPTTNYLLKSVNAEHLGNSQIFDNGTNVGIGTLSPSASLDIPWSGTSGKPTLLLGATDGGATRTDATAKNFRIGGAHYTNTQPAYAVIVGNSNSTDNLINIGGGTLLLNGATAINFYVTSSNTSSNGSSPAWQILGSGVFQSIGAQTLRTSTGNLTLATAAGNGNIVLSPHGTGMVGVGTVNPTTKLHVEGIISTVTQSIAAPQLLQVINTQPPGLNTGSSLGFVGSSSLEMGQISARWSGSLTTRTNLSFFIRNSSLTEAMRIRHDGTVQLGFFDEDLSPYGGQLQVAGTSHLQNGALVSATLKSEDGINIFASSGIYWYTGSLNSLWYGSSTPLAGGLNYTAAGGLRFFTNGIVTPRMIINTSGNVGIGTTSPGSLLHVQGAISGASVALTGTLTSTQATGTAPFTVASTTAVTNLNADLLDGNHASAFYLASNPSGYTSNTGTVTSVGGTGTVSGLTLTGTVTTTGNLTLGGTLSVAASNFSSQTANTFLAAPNGSAGVPTFRAIVAADVPALSSYLPLSGGTMTGNITVNNYTETLFSTTGNTTVNLSNGTVQRITTNASPTTITLPSSVSGKSFVIIVAYGGAHSISWAGGTTIKWVGGTTPTPTSVNGKFDIFTFFQDGTNTYGSIFGQNF